MREKQQFAYRALEDLLTPEQNRSAASGRALKVQFTPEAMNGTQTPSNTSASSAELKKMYECEAGVLTRNVEAYQRLERAAQAMSDCHEVFRGYVRKAVEYIAEHYVHQEETPQPKGIEKMIAAVTFWRQAPRPQFTLAQDWQDKAELKPLFQEIYAALHRYDHELKEASAACAEFERTKKRADEFLRSNGKEPVTVAYPIVWPRATNLTTTIIGEEQRWTARRKVILAKYT